MSQNHRQTATGKNPLLPKDAISDGKDIFPLGPIDIEAAMKIVQTGRGLNSRSKGRLDVADRSICNGKDRLSMQGCKLSLQT